MRPINPDAQSSLSLSQFNNKTSIMVQKKGKDMPNDDFRRKVIKVGRKIKKSNVTSVAVSSKKLHVVKQAGVTHIVNSANEGEKLQSILKQVTHYSENNRVIALKSLTQFLEESKEAQSHIGICDTLNSYTIDFQDSKSCK